MDAKNIGGTIFVSEHDENGNLRIKTVPASYVAYVDDEYGPHRSITGQKLRRVSFKTKKALQQAKQKKEFAGKQFWESDVNPTYRFLERHYPQDDLLPELRITIFDIEVDKDKEKGFSSPDNPFNPIISFTVYHKWSKQAITVAIPPPGMSMEQAVKLCGDRDHPDGYGQLDEAHGYYFVDDEIQLLEIFAGLIQDTDVLAGWNCMPTGSSIWLEDRITTLADCRSGQSTYLNGSILAKKATGTKQVYQIGTAIGSNIFCSADHRIPIAIKPKDEYRNHNTIVSDIRDLTAEECRVIQSKNDHDLFVLLPKHENCNPDLKYSDVFSEGSSLEIPDSHFRILGLIFTDGSIGDGISIYSSKSEICSYYGDLIRQNSLGTGNWGVPHKNNRRTRITVSKISDLLCFIHDGKRKHLKLELLSRLSTKQFRSFIAGMIDGDGCLSYGSFSICNYEGQLATLQELLIWNGVLATINGDGTVLRFCQTDGNIDFVESLQIVHSNRQLLEFSTIKRKSSNKKARIYSAKDAYWVRLDLVTKTEISTEMADIQTEKHYFFSGGIKVHNCEFYDLVYIINRSRHVIGGESLEQVSDTEFLPTEKSREYLERLSAFRVLPDVVTQEVYKRKERTYQILGRRNLDYLVLYKKFIKAELHSFTLDAILQHEVNQSKVKYDGSIDEFYRRQFRTFLAYNRQDVMGLSAIDDKLRLINMANQMVHMSGVTLDKAVGSVAIIEQAVLRELHRERGEIAWDRVEHDPDRYVPGAFVVDPKSGKFGWGGSYDVNSLYPTMIRLLNISPETMVGQLDLIRTEKKLNEYVDDFLRIPQEDRKRDGGRYQYRDGRADKAVSNAYTHAWHQFTGVLEYHDVISGSPNMVKLVTPESVITMTGRKLRDLIKQNNWCITANGTVFDLSREGIIPYCLTKWYNERAEYRKKAGKLEEQALAARKNGDTAQAEELSKQAAFYDMVQNAKKLFLNSTYGAYLNRFFRFYDPRCGRSVTLSGRVVVKHMSGKACELLAGSYDFVRDVDVLLGGDTDSIYISYEKFLTDNGIEKTLDNVVEIGDWVGEQINESFAQHLSEQFLVPTDRCKIVEVKRETIFDRAIFKNKKKRYAMHVLDKEKKRIPKGHKDELKIVGMEVKRSDTPKIIQDFLQECLHRVLVEGYEEEDLREHIEEFRNQFRNLPPWKQGSPVRVSNFYNTSEALNEYDRQLDEHNFDADKPQPYFAVTAAQNTNTLMDRFSEQRWEKLKDGDKVDVLYLEPKNQYGVDSIAIRVGETYIPDWFQELPFDTKAQEEKLIDKKLDNVFGGLGWDFSPRDHDGYEMFK